MLSVEGKMPVSAADTEIINFFIAMMENMSVREITDAPSSSRQPAARASARQITYTVDGTTKTFGSGTANAFTSESTWPADDASHLWVTADDGVAYTIIKGESCRSKARLTQETEIANLQKASCLTIIADVNGLAKTPNLIEPQSDIPLDDQTSDMDTLTGDQYYIFVGSDGITTGSKLTNAGARIIADMK